MKRAARIVTVDPKMYDKSVPVAQSPLTQSQCTKRTRGQRNMDCCCSSGGHLCSRTAGTNFANCCRWIKQQRENNCNFAYELYRRKANCPRGKDPLSTWKVCAKEGAHCSFSGSAFVQYGAFGHDGRGHFSPNGRIPIPPSSSLHPPIQNAGKDCWAGCNANQGKCPWCGPGGVCCRKGWWDKRNGCNGDMGISGKGHVCVADGAWRPTEITKANGVSCTNAQFGDPIVGTVKYCYFKC